MTDKLNTLEEKAHKRQERLKSLKRKRDDKSSNEASGVGDDAKSLPTPRFRSYKPQDKSLSEHTVEKNDTTDVKTEVKELLDLAKNEMVIDQLDISSLAPRQPDWDLKRDAEKKLEKLGRRTQKAMAELIRERLKAKQDLSEVANAPLDV